MSSKSTEDWFKSSHYDALRSGGPEVRAALYELAEKLRRDAAPVTAFDPRAENPVETAALAGAFTAGKFAMVRLLELHLQSPDMSKEEFMAAAAAAPWGHIK